MRTTIRLPDELLIEAKQAATESRQTLTAFIEDALRESLARRRRAVKGAPARLTTCGGDGLQPGVDLDDSAALMELMEAVDDSG